MKTNAIIRILLYSLAIFLLLGILLTVLGVGQLRFDLGTLSGEYITGDGAVDADQIRNIEIEWVSGDIDIRLAAGDSQQILFSESGYAGDNLRMVWEQKGDTLIIKYSQPTVNIGFISTPDKALQIDIPADWYCENLDITTVSGSVDVMQLKAAEIELENVSATCTLECSAQEVSITTVSGEIEYRGEVDTLECETVSADCSLMLDRAPRQLKLESVSGDMIVGLPENAGFTAKLDSVSGDIYTDFATSTHNGSQVYGDGSCQIGADTISGDIEIKRYESSSAKDTNA